MGKGAVEFSAAFTASGLSAATAEKPAFVGLVLVAPAGAAEAFGINVLRLAAAFADLAAERMTSLTEI